MHGIPNISEAANLGVHAMVWLARPEAPGSAPVSLIAHGLGVSESHLGKVLQRLAHAGLLSSTRGQTGGFALARPARQIDLLQIIEAIDGPLAAEPCLLGKPVCERGTCGLTALLAEVTEKVRQGLSGMLLADFAEKQYRHEEV
jgi:Rrf2 family protein